MSLEALEAKKALELIVLEKNNPQYDSLLMHYNVPIKKVPEKLFKEIAETQTPQGVMTLIKKDNHCLSDVIERTSFFFLLLDQISDPGNMGTIIRSADAFGVDAVLLTKGCVDPYCGKSVRATMGSILRVPIIELTQTEEEKLENDVTLNFFSAMLHGEEIKNWQPKENRNILVLGNEANGVEDKWLSISKSITIPMQGRTESLNVGVAGSILMQRMTEKI
jgi:TrmH family RNA methyltransferase